MPSDNHMHTSFSGDSESDPFDMIRAAKKKGLSGLTFTDHLDWDYTHDPGLFDLDLEAYYPAMQKIRESESTDTFTIRTGIELGLQPHLAGRHAKLLSSYSFDVVIGSIHQVNGRDPYYDDFFEGRTIREAYEEYLSCTLNNIEAFSDFDTLGHLDYVSRYGMRYAKAHRMNGLFLYDDHAAAIDNILDLIINKDISLEVNTGAFGYGFFEPNPSYEILRRYRSLGGKNITLGADAHIPERVGGAFDLVVPALKDIGFSSYLVFTNRSSEEYPL